MKVIGTIVEFNPLHNGHCYAIQQMKARSHADLIIAVMSGNFTMRGELSIFDKFEKTRHALAAGIDIVIELPFIYSVQNADFFAAEAIRLLHLAKINELWIGSEINDPSAYEKAYDQWKKNQKSIEQSLKEGYSYKAATAKILSFKSNDMLGFCYYKAIQENNYAFSIHTIQRVGAGYLDENPKEFASSYGIRKNMALLAKYAPSFVHPKNIHNPEALYPFLKYQILTQNIDSLKNIFMVDEGLEHRLKHINEFENTKDYVSFLVSKRYTKSRIQRMLCYLLFQITKERLTMLRSNPTPFLRVLGYSSIGLSYLNRMKKEVDIKTNIKEGIHPIYDIELQITKILDSIFKTNTFIEEQKGPITGP